MPSPTQPPVRSSAQPSGTRGFAVVDFETTGLVPERGDRAIEIGVVLLDPDGGIEHEDETLIHVRRDLGMQSLHRIRAADLRQAPEFDGIARQLRGYLAGRVFVAHNAAFDSRVLRCEYARLGYDVPVHDDTSARSDHVPALRDDAITSHGSGSTMLCTMRLGSRLFGVRSLADCCRRFHIGNPDAHSALSDARATALLLHEYMRMVPDWPGWAARLDAAERAPWPRIDGDIARWMPRPSHMAERERTFNDDYDNAVEAGGGTDADFDVDPRTPAPPTRLREGDRIVLTGAMSQRRADWVDDLAAMGITVWPSVTKKVRLVVAADVDTESTKARKARAYNIPIVSERWLKAALANGIDI
ncbi:exonuclease [Bifidobacterium sp. SMB2]|uniref:Exonuclease n=1 Tax=Bifidobacterium saimiriisciurei TaxID=2661627 RepID=A0ABX0CJE9_9BIFI|nr:MULTISPECIES: exonuclease domain-containing protein [Bifidobacterium]NEG96749.1 exonuclease [Bifidobacterium sp. SMB2]NEH12500.1 exonuclease [Bifidobacterium saimiriisciurei]